MPEEKVPEGSADDDKLALPSLSLGFRRKRKRKGAAAEVPAGDTTDEAVSDPASENAFEEPPPAEAAPDSEKPLVELGSEADEPDLVEPETTDTTPARPAQAVEAEAEPTAAAGETEPDPGDTEVGTMYPEPMMSPDHQDAEPLLAHTRHDDEDTQVLRADTEDEDTSTGIDWGDGATTPAAGPVPAASVPASGPKPPKPKRLLSPTGVDGRVAAVATGLVVGLTGVAGTYLFQRGCEAVKGTGSCGTIGLLLLVVVLVAMILEGGALLRVFKQSDSLSTSFLAVGLVAVIAMLFFLPVIERWYMVVVIPLVAAGTYLLSWWVTSSFGDNAPAKQAARAEAATERESADRS